MFLAIEVTSGHIVSAVLGALFALIVERMVTGSRSGVACPSCGDDLPKHRKPRG